MLGEFPTVIPENLHAIQDAFRGIYGSNLMTTYNPSGELSHKSYTSTPFSFLDKLYIFQYIYSPGSNNPQSEKRKQIFSATTIVYSKNGEMIADRRYDFQRTPDGEIEITSTPQTFGDHPSRDSIEMILSATSPIIIQYTIDHAHTEMLL